MQRIAYVSADTLPRLEAMLNAADYSEYEIVGSPVYDQSHNLWTQAVRRVGVTAQGELRLREQKTRR